MKTKNSIRPEMAEFLKTRRTAKAVFIHPRRTAKALMTYECVNAYNRVIIPAESAKDARRTVERNPTYGHFFRTLKTTVRKMR